MKKLNFLTLAIYVGLLLVAIVSCTKDEDETVLYQEPSENNLYSDVTGPVEVMDMNNDKSEGNTKCGTGHPATQGILAAVQLYQDAANAGDFDLWMSNWAEDGVRMAPGEEPIVGKDAIAASMQPVFEILDLEVDIYQLDDIEVHGDVGFTRCRYTIYATPKGGGERFAVEPDGKALTIFRHYPKGNWKIAYDCINSNLPPVQN